MRKTTLARAVIAATVALAATGMSIGPAGAAPSNNQFANAELLAASGSIVRSNVGATGQAGEPAPITGTAYATIWFKWVAPSTGRTTFDTIGSEDFDTVLSVYTGSTLTTLVEEASDDDGFDCDFQSWLQLDVVAGRTYYVQIGSYDNSDTTTDLHLNWNGGAWGSAPANDNFAQRTALASTSSVVAGTTFASTWENAVASDYGIHSVWYSYTAAAPTTLTVGVTDAVADNAFGYSSAVSADVYQGAPATLAWIDGASDGSPTSAIDLAAGESVSISVSSTICEEGAFTLDIDAAVSGTVVTSQYSQAEVDAVNTLLAAKFGGMSLSQFQHDAVGAWVYIYALSGTHTPTPIVPPATGPVAVATTWTTADYPALAKLSTQWATSDSATQQIAVLVLAYLVAVYG